MQSCNWFAKLRVSVRSEQASPLTDRALEILDKIKKGKRDYRNTALTDWARQGVNVDIAMKASGHTLVQMQRYLDLQTEDIPKAFGLHEQGRRRGRVASS